MNKQKRVLVTGGAGYIGSVLVPLLLDSGLPVRVVDALLYDNDSVIEPLKSRDKFEFIKGNISDQAVIRTSLEGCTDVVHLAALVGDPICRKYPDLARLYNFQASVSLINEASGHGIDRFVFVSTCSNYGLRTDEKMATEEADLNPLSLYAETKVAVEQYLLKGEQTNAICPTVLRLATAHGLSPRMRFDLTVSEFTRELFLGHKLGLYDFETWRPYCHVADISKAILTVLTADKKLTKGRVFNVGDNDEHFTKEKLVELIITELGRGEVEKIKHSVDPRNYRVSFDLIDKILGFRALTSVSQSIALLKAALEKGGFDDFDNRRNFYHNQSISV